MRKLVYLIVLLLVGAVVALPWLVGYHYKSVYESLLQTINQKSPLKVELVDYQEGYLSSDVELRVDLNSKSHPIRICFSPLNNILSTARWFRAMASGLLHRPSSKVRFIW
jgi:hypothetical protein